jgi:hypothetical protein
MFWPRLTVAGWEEESDRVSEVGTQTTVGDHTGLPPVPMRWVRIRDPADIIGFRSQRYLWHLYLFIITTDRFHFRTGRNQAGWILRPLEPT